MKFLFAAFLSAVSATAEMSPLAQRMIKRYQTEGPAAFNKNPNPNPPGGGVSPPPHLNSSKCEAMPIYGSFGPPYFVSDDVDNDTPGIQTTDGALCYDFRGLHIITAAMDYNIISPYTSCNSEVFVSSSVLETFIAPVDDLNDDPQWYYELDVSPSGAMWGGLSNNTLGNSSKCIASDGVCVEGLLSCSGLNEFEVSERAKRTSLVEESRVEARNCMHSN